MSRTIRWASLHQELIFYSCIYKICWDCSNKVWYGFCSCIRIPGLRTIDSIEIGTWWSRQKWRATILAVLRRNVSEFLGNNSTMNSHITDLIWPLSFLLGGNDILHCEKNLLKFPVLNQISFNCGTLMYSWEGSHEKQAGYETHKRRPVLI